MHLADFVVTEALERGLGVKNDLGIWGKPTSAWLNSERARFRTEAQTNEHRFALTMVL